MPTTYEIHPAIGIARLGSSRMGKEEGCFIGPEPGCPPPAKYRDPVGDLKRGVARFRIYVCARDGRGHLLDARELTLDGANKITWMVHLANRKGVARRQYGTRPGFRNNATGDDDRDRELIINPGLRSVDRPGAHEIFDTGLFRSTRVPLGEIEMEPCGRLRVVGGHGRSGSDPQQSRLDLDKGHFADNDNWYDDTSDGPVRATIELTDGTIVQSTAWVIVAPPDFAPGIKNLVTLYDVLYDLAIKRGILPSPADLPGGVSFVRHIQPILNRATGYRWVNRAAAFGYDKNGMGHWPGGVGDFSGQLSTLSDPSSAAQERRVALFRRLRDPDSTAILPEIGPFDLIPRLSDQERIRFGPGNVLSLTTTQYKIMRAWANGDFVNDLGSDPPREQLLPDTLDRVTLEACVGGALYPGIEASGYVMTDPTRFLDGEPFRLSTERVRPGEVTQYNALPWQADFLYCRWEEIRGSRLHRLGWWPAQRPDDVFTTVGAKAMETWDRGLGPDYQDMIDWWDRLGMVVNRGTAEAPFFVEDERDIHSLGP